MPRSRAWRRHMRRVKLNRRYAILREVHGLEEVVHWGMLRPQARYLHLRCNCWDDPRDYGRTRRCRERRAWRELERSAS